MADLFGRPSQRAHRDHNAEHGRHDTQPRQGVRHGVQSSHRSGDFTVVDFDIQLHHLIQLEMTHAAADGHAQRVADEENRVMVLHESLVLGE